MYSVVLMMAISGGAEAPDHGLRHHGGGGCSGGGYSGCYGGGSGGCYGAAVASCGCSGGGGRHGMLGGLFGGRRHGGGGCNGGGCYGGGGGCYGGGGGCYGGGGVVVGGCYGGGYGGCSGGGVIMGGCYGGGYGCTGGHPVMGGPGMSGGKPAEDVKKMPKPEGEKKPEGETKQESSFVPAVAPATLVVSLPADAKLTIDDNTTSSTGAQRTFVTPNLKTGGEYHYTLKAEMVRAGKSNVIERVVTVRPGELTQVTLDQAPTSVAAR